MIARLPLVIIIVPIHILLLSIVLLIVLIPNVVTQTNGK